VITFKTETTFELSFKEPMALSYLLIYPNSLADLVPASVSVLINDEYYISEVKFSDVLRNPALVSFDNLPKNYPVSNIKLTFTAKEGSDECSVSEITAVSK